MNNKLNLALKSALCRQKIRLSNGQQSPGQDSMIDEKSVRVTHFL